MSRYVRWVVMVTAKGIVKGKWHVLRARQIKVNNMFADITTECRRAHTVKFCDFKFSKRKPKNLCKMCERKLRRH